MPATEARNYLEQASALSKIGEFQQAIPLYESALSTLERIHGGDQPELAECLQELGDAYEAAYRLSDALRIHTRLLKLGERILGKTNPNIVAMLFKLAQLNEMLGRPVDALDWCNQSLQAARQALPQTDPLSMQIADSHRYLTGLVESQKQAEAAAAAAIPPPQWQAGLSAGEMAEDNGANARIQSHIELDSHPVTYRPADNGNGPENPGQMRDFARDMLASMPGNFPSTPVTSSPFSASRPAYQNPQPAPDMVQDFPPIHPGNLGPQPMQGANIHVIPADPSAASGAPVASGQPAAPGNPGAGPNPETDRFKAIEAGFMSAQVAQAAEARQAAIAAQFAQPDGGLSGHLTGAMGIQSDEPYSGSQISPPGPTVSGNFPPTELDSNHEFLQQIEGQGGQKPVHEPFYDGQNPNFATGGYGAHAYEPGGEGYNLSDLDSIRTGVQSRQEYKEFVDDSDDPRGGARGARKRLTTEDSQQIKSMRLLKTFGLPLGVVLAIFAVTLFVFLRPQSPAGDNPADKGGSSAGAPAAISGARFGLYRTSDESKEIRLTSSTEAIMVNGASGITVPYALISNNWGDLLSAMFSSAFEKQVWSEKRDSGLKTQDDIVYYEPDSAEFKTIDKMRKVAAVAQAHFMRFGEYPKKVDGDMAGEFAYVNPLTGRGSAITIQPMLSRTIDGSDSLAALQSGIGVGEELTNTPLTIKCYAAVHSDSEDRLEGVRATSFYVRGTDRNGIFLASGQAGQVFVVSAADVYVNLPANASNAARAANLKNKQKGGRLAQNREAARVAAAPNPNNATATGNNASSASGEGASSTSSTSSTSASTAKAAPIALPAVRTEPPVKNTKLWIIANPAWPMLLIHHSLPLFLLVITGLVYLKARMVANEMDNIPAADRGINPWLVAAAVAAGVTVLVIISQFVIFA